MWRSGSCRPTQWRNVLSTIALDTPGAPAATGPASNRRSTSSTITLIRPVFSRHTPKWWMVEY